jgi:hypothetical protein
VNKLPVGETIGFAYRFTFSQLGTIIGLIWVPMVAIAVLEFLPYGLGDAGLTADANPALLAAAQFRGIAFALASTLLYACIYVCVSQQALGLRKGGAVVHFVLGRAELRMWGTLLLLCVIAVFFVMALAFVTFAVSQIVAKTGNKEQAFLVMYGLLFVGACAFVFAIVRLAFLLVPVTVAEGKIGLERGWKLTHGNFWRISLVLFVVALPGTIVLICGVIALVGKELVELAQVAPKLPEALLQDRMQTIVSHHMPELIGINLIIAPFSLGLTLGAMAFGYRALTAAPTGTEHSVATEFRQG